MRAVLSVTCASAHLLPHNALDINDSNLTAVEDMALASANLNAGNNLSITGADLAAGQDLTLLGKSVAIDPGRDASNGKLDSKMTQDGLTLAVGGTLVNAIETVQTMSAAASAGNNPRMQALAAAIAAIQVIAENGLSQKIS